MDARPAARRMTAAAWRQKAAPGESRLSKCRSSGQREAEWGNSAVRATISAAALSAARFFSYFMDKSGPLATPPDNPRRKCVIGESERKSGRWVLRIRPHFESVHACFGIDSLRRSRLSLHSLTHSFVRSLDHLIANNPLFLSLVRSFCLPLAGVCIIETLRSTLSPIRSASN